MSCSRKKRMTGKQLYEANHLYLMIAFMLENSRKMPPQHLISRKDDPSYYHARKFQFAPLDGAHYANFSCILNQNEQEKIIHKCKGIMNTRHKLSVSKMNSNQSRQNRYYFHFYLETRTNAFKYSRF
jgi:hypothetical protein